MITSLVEYDPGGGEGERDGDRETQRDGDRETVALNKEGIITSTVGK